MTVELHHELGGSDDEPTVILGGSLGTTLAMWEPQVSVLERRWRTVAFDHRGHGGSPVPRGPYTAADLGRDVLALMDRLGIARASYCGLSLGGVVGQWLAINAPERIDRLVLISTGSYLPPAQQWSDRAAAVRAAGTPEVVADAVVARWFTPPFAAANHELVARHRAMIAATPAEGYASCCEVLTKLDLRNELASIRAATLVISGAQDPSIPPERGEAIAHAVPGARFELVDPGAHLASVERPSEINRLIERHLEASR
jgi:3-oxoadipate enol-lactonase